jgi:hypothetical protein
MTGRQAEKANIEKLILLPDFSVKNKEMLCILVEAGCCSHDLCIHVWMFICIYLTEVILACSFSIENISCSTSSIICIMENSQDILHKE